MRRFPLLQTVGMLLVLLWSVPGRAIDPATLANRGNGSVTACAGCHGKDGGGQASFPRLAGMNAAYLLKQLQDFESGRRRNATMQPIARALSPADRKALAGYYATLPVPAAAAATQQDATGQETPGARLATRGLWSKGIPACVQCHGPGGRGVGNHFPAIAGQPAGYLSAQLQAWRTGTRTNDPLELMRHLSRRLSEDEIAAVSAWFARQSPVPAEGTP